jgi:hypothetical protein
MYDLPIGHWEILEYLCPGLFALAIAALIGLIFIRWLNGAFTVPGAEDLTRPTTLAECQEHWLSDIQGQFHRRWNAVRDQVETALRKGGDLWEWEVLDAKKQGKQAGIAVVRAGEIVRTWKFPQS